MTRNTTLLFSRLSNVSHTRVLKYIEKKPMCARELMAVTKMSQAHMSKVLRELCEVDVIEVVNWEKSWKRIKHGHKYYQVSPFYKNLKIAVA